MLNQNPARFIPSETGPAYWGPGGDLYHFIATGAQTGGAYFMFEAIVPPGGGPPLHIHRLEEESFYLLEGSLEITMGDQQIKAVAGDCVQLPINIPHSFCNKGTTPAKMLVLCTPAGPEKFFVECLDPVVDRSIPSVTKPEDLITRLLAAAPRYGLEFLPH